TFIGGSVQSADTGFDFAITRLTPSGKVDTSFGNRGTVTTDFLWPIDVTAQASVADDHGGLYVVAATNAANDAPGALHYRPDGSLDSSFGKNGVSFLTGFDPTKVALSPDGKLIVLGTGVDDQGAWLELKRLLPNGRLDPTFGDHGVSRTPTSFLTHD